MAIIPPVPPTRYSNSSGVPGRPDPSEPTPAERITNAFQTLTTSAKAINDVSGELAKPIVALEQALQRLNLGVACWTQISGGSDELEHWSQDLGYARVRGRWCLAVRKVQGQHVNPDRDEIEIWPFNEAPLYQRINAVDKLPDLIESLVDATNATAKRLHKKVAPTQELATAVSALLNSKKKK